MEKTNIGKFLRQRREELKLTQRQIALNVGVTESAVSRWESGEIGSMRRDRIAKLAEMLKISPLVIMGAEEYINKPLNLSSEQSTLLSDFNGMNQEGKTMALGLLRSLRVAHPKQPPAVKHNSDNGSNFGVVGGNFNSQVTIG